MSTYDPQRLNLIWGVIAISGYADGSMVQISPQGDGVRAITGTAGETAFIETPNRQHEVMFRLMETSPINGALMLLFEAGNVPAPLSLTSLSTGAGMIADAAKLERIPGVTYDNNVPVREWKLIVPKLATILSPIRIEP
jgi:hypothetical protein